MDVLCTVGRNINGAADVKTVWWFLKKLKIELFYDTAILLMDVSPKELKAWS